MTAWAGSTRIQVTKTRVGRIPECAVHPTDERPEGVLSIHWQSLGTGPGHVYSCWDCAEGPFGRFAHALDDSPESSVVQVELLVAERAEQIAEAA